MGAVCSVSPAWSRAVCPTMVKHLCYWPAPIPQLARLSDYHEGHTIRLTRRTRDQSAYNTRTRAGEALERACPMSSAAHWLRCRGGPRKPGHFPLPVTREAGGIRPLHFSCSSIYRGTMASHQTADQICSRYTR